MASAFESKISACGIVCIVFQNEERVVLGFLALAAFQEQIAQIELSSPIVRLKIHCAQQLLVGASPELFLQIALS